MVRLTRIVRVTTRLYVTHYNFENVRACSNTYTFPRYVHRINVMQQQQNITKATRSLHIG